MQKSVQGVKTPPSHRGTMTEGDKEPSWVYVELVMSRYPKKESHSVRLLDFELYPGPWSRAGLRDSFLTDTKGAHRGCERVSIKRRIKIQLVDQPHP